MTDYNWKSCADPANAARLRELLDGTRDIILRIVGVKGLVNIRATRHCWGFTDAVSFLDPDEPAQMRARIAELEAENYTLQNISKQYERHVDRCSYSQNLPTIEEMSGLISDFTDGRSIQEYLDELYD